MFLDRFLYEIRLMGRKVVLTPLLVILAIALLAVILYATGGKLPAERLLTACLEMLLPLAAGFVIATVAAHDPAIELQLTMPRQYRSTALSRLAFIAGWTACISLISGTLIFLLHVWWGPAQLNTWSSPLQFLVGQLTWLATLLWFTSASLCLGLLIRSRSASNTVIGGIWVLQLLLYTTFLSFNYLQPLFLFPTTIAPEVDFWLSNRIAVLTIGIVLLIPAWLLLRQTESLLKGAGEE